jgi:hypothetical protein
MVAWYLLAVIALLALGGLSLAASYRSMDKRTAATEESSRRAHLRLDNQQRQLEAIAKDLGWADNHAWTRVIDQPLPSKAVTARPPPLPVPPPLPESLPTESEPTQPSIF